MRHLSRKQHLNALPCLTGELQLEVKIHGKLILDQLALLEDFLEISGPDVKLFELLVQGVKICEKN